MDLSKIITGGENDSKAASLPEMRMGKDENGREGLLIFVPLPNDPPRTKDGEGKALMLGNSHGFQTVPGTKSRVNLTWTVKA